MDEDIFYGLAAALAVLFGGMTIFVPVLAITLRFALRPVLETWARIRQSQTSDQHYTLLDRRMGVLETEIQQVQHAVQSLVDIQEFQRKLSEPAGNHRTVGEPSPVQLPNGSESRLPPD